MNEILVRLKNRLSFKRHKEGIANFGQTTMSEERLLADQTQIRATNERLLSDQLKITAINERLLSDQLKITAINERLLADQGKIKALNDHLLSDQSKIAAINDQTGADFSLVYRSEDFPGSPLADAKLHLAQSITSTELPHLGVRWDAFARHFRDRIQSIQSVAELLAFGQMTSSGIESHLMPRELAGFCQWIDLDLLGMNLPPDLLKAVPSFSAPPYTVENWVVEYRSTNIDYVSICAARDILTILHWLAQHRPMSICDIGGGTGKYAHAWLTNSAHRPDLLVIVDIPETLIFSEVLLRNSFANSVQYISSPSDVPQRSGIVLCPISNIKAIEPLKFDLITNVGSMQEMSDEWITWYMQWLDQQPCSYFFSNNYFAMALTNMREGHNAWSPRPSSRWQLVQSKIDLGMRNTASLLFKKDAAKDVAMRADEASGVKRWLHLLDCARVCADEKSLREALDFALNSFPFIPKEAWHVAKLLASVTQLKRDQKCFAWFDNLRKNSQEAAH